MKIGVRSQNGAVDRLQFAQQIGADGASIWAWACPGYNEQCYLTVENVLDMRARFQKYELELTGIGLDGECIKNQLLGLPGRDQEIEYEGDGDMVANFKVLKEIGYEGYIVPDHHFGLVGDDEWTRSSRAWQVGYIRGLMQALDI